MRDQIPKRVPQKQQHVANGISLAAQQRDQHILRRMFTITDAQAAAIRTTYKERGELSAAVELLDRAIAQLLVAQRVEHVDLSVYVAVGHGGSYWQQGLRRLPRDRVADPAADMQ